MEQGLQQGMQRGARQGQAKMVVSLLTHKLGDLNDQQEALIENLSSDQIEALGKALLDFRVVEDLVGWLEHTG